MISRRNAITGAGAAVGVGMATSASALLASDAKPAKDMADAMLLTRAVLDLHAMHDIPNSVFIAPDFKTKNLIVIKGELGFAVTGEAIDGGLHFTMFGPALKGLIEADAQLKSDPHDTLLRSRLGLMEDRTKTVFE